MWMKLLDLIHCSPGRIFKVGNQITDVCLKWLLKWCVNVCENDVCLFVICCAHLKASWFWEVPPRSAKFCHFTHSWLSNWIWHVITSFRGNQWCGAPRSPKCVWKNIFINFMFFCLFSLFCGDIRRSVFYHLNVADIDCYLQLSIVSWHVFIG